MSGVLFVVMPFGPLEFPHIGVSLLKAQLRARGIPAAIAYLNFPFVEAAGYQAYRSMTISIPGNQEPLQWRYQGYDYYGLVGEWIFARSLFSHTSEHDDDYIRYLLANGMCAPEMVDGLRHMAALVEPFLDYCMRAVDWDRYSVVGFTSTFQQNLASLALARRIKERFPEKIIVMGGQNCSDVLGVQLHKSFPFLDYVFTGDADFSFPELVSRLGNGNGRRDDIPGQVRREATGSVVTAANGIVDAMDALSYPDFDDYLASYRISPLRHLFTPALQMETSRGCWWGAKHHCTFCGLNANGMAFRAKSPQRVMDELVHLVSRYKLPNILVVDNILSMDYFKNFLPELKRRKLGVQLLYETKANLNREQVQLLADAGVRTIQPGIESLSSGVLALMRKGVSPLQNVQLLKWCKEYGVHPCWNVLYGFPGETAADYDEMCRIAENLSHLTPPGCGGDVRVERFSPYFDYAGDFGIRNVRVHPSYRYIYPFDDSVLYNLAYFFDFDFDGRESVEGWSAEILGLIERWNYVHGRSRLEVVSRTPDAMVVCDTRPNAVNPLYRFGMREAAVIDACDRAQTLPQIVKQVRRTLNGSMPQDTWIDAFVRYLTDCRLVLNQDGHYLSLIVSQPKPAPPALSH
jgi:ribosomal peptide maturation radical SAM protein 1